MEAGHVALDLQTGGTVRVIGTGEDFFGKRMYCVEPLGETGAPSRWVYARWLESLS